MSTATLKSAHLFQGHKAAVYALCAGAEPDTFLTAGGEGIVVQWHLDRPDEGEAIVNVGEAVFSLCLLAARQLLLIGTGTGRLLVVDLRTKREVQAIEAHTKGIFRITPLDDRTLACAGGDGALSTWHLHEQPAPALKAHRRIPLCEEKLRDVVLSATGERIVVACGDGSLRELDARTMNEHQRFAGHEKGANAAAFHPSKPALISGGKDGQVKVWHADGRCLLAFAAHKGSVYATTFDPTGTYLATAGRDALLKFWDANSLEPLHRTARERSAHTHSINAVLWLGPTLITASDDRNVRAWRLGE